MIHKYFECSTIHITSFDNMMLGCLIEGTIRIEPHKYGYWICLIDVSENNLKELTEIYSLSENLVSIIRYAIEQDCSWLYLDRDVKPNPKFQTFNWEESKRRS
jgi:hypothetical protein